MLNFFNKSRWIFWIWRVKWPTKIKMKIIIIISHTGKTLRVNRKKWENCQLDFFGLVWQILIFTVIHTFWWIYEWMVFQPNDKQAAPIFSFRRIVDNDDFEDKKKNWFENFQIQFDDQYHQSKTDHKVYHAVRERERECKGFNKWSKLDMRSVNNNNNDKNVNFMCEK